MVDRVNARARLSTAGNSENCPHLIGFVRILFESFWKVVESTKDGFLLEVTVDLKLTDKVVLVTGSTAGIGFAIARSLASEGAHVYLNGRTQEQIGRAHV